ncbi:MAG: glycine betaine ABC transporter substrate-binding protein [Erysipelotrichaceae bacterium]|nr:glycine betaine ABC transporter substrate-binding protein [Erysipelotrichaceae bacterium]
MIKVKGNRSKEFAKRKKTGRVLGLTALLSLSMVFGGCKKEDVVRVAVTEEKHVQILAELFCQLAKEKDIECETRQTQPGIANIHPALENDSLQVGIEYTQTAWSNILQKRTTYRPNDLTELQREYHNRKLYWCNLPRVEDAYSLAVSQEMADEYNLQTLGDLAKISETLVIGAPTLFFEEADAYPLIQENYGMDFKTTVNISEQNVAQNILDQKVDVVSAHSLDGGIKAADLVVLEDDLKVGVVATVGIVVSKPAMMEHPQLNVVAQEIGRILTSEQLADLSQDVLNGVATPEEIARQLLIENDLIEQKE